MTIPLACAPDRRRFSPPPGRWRGVLTVAALVCAAGLAAAQSAADPAAVLRERHTALRASMQASAFGEPMHLRSSEADHHTEGEVHVELAHALPVVAAALGDGGRVCEMLFLHQNVRSCRSTSAPGAVRLALTVGPKRAASGGTPYAMDYLLHTVTRRADYFRVTLDAPRGPLSTRAYHLELEGIALAGGRSFVRLQYGYDVGALGQLALQAWLATAGRAKIGFSTVAAADGTTEPVRGVRAAVERNAVRYVLALQAHLAVPGSGRAALETRLRTWHALTERHAAQLHELTLDDYLQEKTDDLAKGALAAPSVEP